MKAQIIKSDLDKANILTNESLLSLGNGYIGVRGNFEEGLPKSYESIRGTYINAFHDETEIRYGEKLYGFPEKQQKILNVIDAQGVQVYIDDELFSLFEGEVHSFEHKLNMDVGYSERITHWTSPLGKEVKIHYKRFVSFFKKELFVIDVDIEPISEVNSIKIVSTLDGNVSNYVNSSDPRVASGHAKRMNVVKVNREAGIAFVKNRTYESKLEVACAVKNSLNRKEFEQSVSILDHGIVETFIVNDSSPVNLTKYISYTDTLRHSSELELAAIQIVNEYKLYPFDELLSRQKEYMQSFWEIADIQINGDDSVQEGIRFNLYQLLQSVGKEPLSNISAKGLSGEGYEGHYFWDTEIYIFPVFLMINPSIAKNLLLHRYSILEHAKQRALEMGHKKGALFPWRTITGIESSAFFPAGTAQYHISADIAYSYIQYYLATKDDTFLKEYTAEVLIETARLWDEVGHMHNGKYRIDSVTGPDEYTCIVNNNYYTNVMAKHNLLWAAKVYKYIEQVDPNKFKDLKLKLNVTDEEAANWKKYGDQMYLPYDETLKINAQDDSFLQKDKWDLVNTPKDKYPLLLHYHPLTLYRYQVLKQADTILAHFLLEDEENLDTIKNTYDYYEQITTHDSSLSACVHSIMASKLGYQQKAYDYFIETVRMDIDNTHKNTKDGLHMANMGGTWMAIVYGFAGMRLKESGISFSPILPERWDSYSFHVRFQGCVIHVYKDTFKTRYSFIEGESLSLKHNQELFVLDKENSTKIFS